MAFPSISNVDGSNPGPTSAVPDVPQSPIGNLWKVGRFALTITPVAVAAATAAVQTFTATGIGLLTTDVVEVSYSDATAPTGAVGVLGAYVSAADALSIQFINPTAAALTPIAGVYYVTVFRVQPNWVAPSSGNQIDF